MTKIKNRSQLRDGNANRNALTAISGRVADQKGVSLEVLEKVVTLIRNHGHNMTADRMAQLRAVVNATEQHFANRVLNPSDLLAADEFALCLDICAPLLKPVESSSAARKDDAPISKLNAGGAPEKTKDANHKEATDVVSPAITSELPA